MASLTIEDRYSLFTSGISGLNRCIQTIKAMALQEFQLKGSSVNCLFYLSQHPDGLTVTELAELCQEDKAAVSRNISALQSKDYVVMHSVNGKKYRARFCLTPSGQVAADSLYETIRSSVEAGGRELTDEDRTILYRFLKSIWQGLQDYIGS